MEFSCLSEGKGYYFPPCHILDVCGFRVLFDCPMDLSSLTVFSHVPVYGNSVVSGNSFSGSCQKDVGCEPNEGNHTIDKPLDVNSLIHAEPRYKTVKNLLLWDVSFIDVVLISSPMGMLGLPFLTRNKEFSAKVYATEAAARIGQLMMRDLINMHKEFRQFYGPEGRDGPQWMKWHELESLPLELREILLGADGMKFFAWMSLYSAADLRACMSKVKSLKYGEEACYNGILVLKACSSGLEIGSCNWSITGPKGRIAYISGSVFSPVAAMGFDYKALQSSDVVLYSDFFSFNAPEQFEDSNLSDDYLNSEAISILLNGDEYSEEMEKLKFICSCSMDTIKAGGSVLIPTGRLGIILQLLELFTNDEAYNEMKVPIFMVSSVAEELMTYTNIIPEWLCKQWLNDLYSSKPSFARVEMLKDGRLRTFPAIHSVELLKIWQEPCIVFCPHWSLRLGPVVHLLHRWCRDENSLLVMEDEVDANLALLPYKPMAMKVLQCSFASGIQVQKYCHLLSILQPRKILFPEALRQHVGHFETSFSFTYYSENDTVHIPYTKDDSELVIEEELAKQLKHTTLGKQDIAMAKLKGELLVEHGRYRLIPRKHELDSSPPMHFGRVDVNVLVTTLHNMGMVATMEEVSGEGQSVVRVEPGDVKVEISEKETLISTGDENAASIVSHAVGSILNCT